MIESQGMTEKTMDDVPSRRFLNPERFKHVEAKIARHQQYLRAIDSDEQVDLITGRKSAPPEGGYTRRS
jgi:hypothetical protein